MFTNFSSALRRQGKGIILSRVTFARLFVSAITERPRFFVLSRASAVDIFLSTLASYFAFASRDSRDIGEAT